MSGTKSKVPKTAKDDLKQQDVVQAVLIADNFTTKFCPLTNEKPAVLLPLVNGILLDYVLQSLEECGIQETFIFCCSLSNLIRSHISSSHWSDPNSPMTATVISSTSFMSVGDIIRELDSKALVRSDFILIGGDVVTTFPLGSMLEQHRKTRQSDKNAALTLVYSEALPRHKTRCKEQEFVVAVEAKSKRIRFYQRVGKTKELHIPLETFQENEEVDIHCDLLDSCTYICSPCVPPLFSDNFDYQNMDDFVKGLLVNEELLGNSMYISVAKSGYAACVSNFVMYDSVSQDIMSRWSYPIAPDLNEMNENQFSQYRRNIYKDRDIEIGRNCQIQQNVVIGKGTKIASNVSIQKSVIGKNCSIGENAHIFGSYIWDDVTIGPECDLNTCLLAENVTLGDKVTVKPGCVLGKDVIIGESITVPEFTKIQSQPFVDDDSFGEDDFDVDQKSTPDACDVDLVGTGGRGFLCRSSSASDDDDGESDVEDVWGKDDGRVENDAEDVDTESSSSEIISAGEIGSEDSDGENDDETAFFYNEVLESLQRGIEEKVKCENLILEINSSKHAYNVTVKEVNGLLVKAFLKLPLGACPAGGATATQYIAAMKPNLHFFQPLVSNYIRSPDSQADCLSSVEDFMRSNEELSPAVMKIVHYWYDQDILNEAVILKWFHNISEENEKIKKQAASFIKWLQEADEESSEE